jgi:DNA polymerase V
MKKPFSTGRIMPGDISEIYIASSEKRIKLPLYQDRLQAGFPSPAEDYIETRLDLNEYLIKHPAATFYCRAGGNSMVLAGINMGDLLIFDRAIDAGNESIVLAVLNGEFTVKRLKIEKGLYYLVPESDSPDYKTIGISGEMQFDVWGVLTYIIKEAV